MLTLFGGPYRPLTPTQEQVADGIFRGLDYKSIGVELAAWCGRCEPISARTVRSHVRDIACLFDAPALTPRVIIYLWALQQRSSGSPTRNAAASADRSTAAKRAYWNAP